MWAGPTNSSGGAADCSLNNAGQHPEWFNFCAPTGNFNVVMTGTWQNEAVYSVFDETNTNRQDVGWEGVDPNGWSENATYDVHSGNVSGVLANICQGTPPTGTPEPGSLFLLGSGLLGLGLARRRKIRG